MYTRRGSDLAMEVRITLAEAIVGFKKTIVGLDGKEIVIGNPCERINVRKDELVDAPSLPELDDDDDAGESNSGNSTNVTSSNDDDTSSTKDFPVQQIVKTTTDFLIVGPCFFIKSVGFGRIEVFIPPFEISRRDLPI